MPRIHHAVQQFRWAVDHVSEWGAYASGLAFLLLAWYVTADVAGRSFLNVSTGAHNELSGYVLAVGLAAGMAYTLKSGGHVRIDMVVQRMGPRTRFFMDQVALVGMLGLAGVLAWTAGSLALRSLEIDARSLSTLTVPLFYPQSLMASGFILLGIQAVAILASGTAFLRKDSGIESEERRYPTL